MRSLAPWGSLLALAVPLESWALGLGEIQGNSFLNERLNAQIPLTATQQELETLRVEMASPTVFAQEGVDYTAVHGGIEFEVGRDANGQPVIFVSSEQLITDPFVTMVVEARTGRSTMYRVLSVLLSPPSFLPETVAEAPIAPPATREPQAASGGQIVREPPAPAPAPAQPAAPQPAAQQPTAPAPAAAGDYTVQAGDTLWGIAERVRPANVSTNQAMLSIFGANPGAFDGNINRLRRGAILRIPPAAQLGSLTAAAATAEVQRQNEAWLSGVASEARLTLIPPSAQSAGSAPASAASQAELAELETEVADLQNELDQTRAELAEAERLLALRNAELANVQNLLEAQAQAAAETPAPEAVAATAAEEAPVFVDDEPAAAQAETEAQAEAEPSAAAVPGVTTAAEGPSLVEQVISYVVNPLVLGAIAVVALLLAGLAFLRRRREDEIDDITGQWEALETELVESATGADAARAAPEPDMVVVEGGDDTGTIEEPTLGDFDSTDSFDEPDLSESAIAATAEIPALDFGEDEPLAAEPEDDAETPPAEQTLSSQTVINLDRDDPVSEADFHMAYGLYDQAADLITKALESDPDNLELKHKLLEVYFVWGNKEAFLERAKALKSEIGGGPDWDKVVIMGKQICPDEPLFSEATAVAGEVDLDLEASAITPGLDFALEESDEDVDLGLAVDDEVELSLEASGAQEARVESPSAGDTLEIGAQTQAGLEAALLDDDDDDDEDREDPASLEPQALDQDATVESPTIEGPMHDAPTVETPTIEAEAPQRREDEATSLGDTVEQPRPAADSGSSTELTAEIELDDLGLDVGDLPEEIGESGAEDIADIGEARASSEEIEFVLDDESDDEAEAEADAELLSATGVTQVLDVDDDEDGDATGMTHTGTAILEDVPDPDTDASGATTEVLEQGVSAYEPDELETEEDLDLNLDDFSSALGGGADTVEQPVAKQVHGVDLDVGADVPSDDEPTGTEEYSPLDPQTMTEVGTKLDLARAYIDMGDPEGARSILEEVLDEGDSTQRTEAQSLIDALPA